MWNVISPLILAIFLVQASSLAARADITTCSSVIQRLLKPQTALLHFEDYGGGFSMHRISIEGAPARFKEYKAMDVLDHYFTIEGEHDKWAMMTLAGKMLEHYLRAGGSYVLKESPEGEPSLDAETFDLAFKFFKNKRLAALHSMKQTQGLGISTQYRDKNLVAVLDGDSPTIRMISMNPKHLSLLAEKFKFKETVTSDTREKVLGKMIEKYINMRNEFSTLKVPTPNPHIEKLELTDDSMNSTLDFFKNRALVVFDSTYVQNGAKVFGNHQLIVLYENVFYRILLENSAIQQAMIRQNSVNIAYSGDNQIAFFGKLFEEYFFNAVKNGSDVSALLGAKKLDPATTQAIVAAHFR